MAEENLRSKHAFGNSENLTTALESGAIDAYDILFLDGNTSNPKMGWIDKDGNPVILKDKEQIVRVTSLPTANGDENVIYIFGGEAYIWNSTEAKCEPLAKSADLSALEAELATKVNAEDVELQIDNAVSDVVTTTNAYTDQKVESTKRSYEKVKYEISYKPEGTLVDYFDKEIRVMCPDNTRWTLQQSGAGANENAYYIGFKAYAPSEDVVSFKEDLTEIITDNTMYYFEDNDFAGVESDGRKYSIVWLPVAVYDKTTGAWTYHGATSSTEHYIGWYYSVEWYNVDGVVVASDCVRINLSNKECHSAIEPFYMSDMIKAAKAYADAQIEAKIAEGLAIKVVEF